MNIIFRDDTELSSVMAAWVNERLQPNIYAVTTLKQATKTNSGFIKGSRDRYQNAADQFIRRLSKRVYGKTIWRRHKPLLPNSITIEGDGATMRWHLNMMFRLPEGMPMEIFEAHFRDEWAKNEWAMPDVYFDERTGDCTAYSLKDGPDALMTGSLSF